MNTDIEFNYVYLIIAIIIFTCIVFMFNSELKSLFDKNIKSSALKHSEHSQTQSENSQIHSGHSQTQSENIKQIQSEQSKQHFDQNTLIEVLLCYSNSCGHCIPVKEWYFNLVNSSPLENVVFIALEESKIPENILNTIPGFPTILIKTSNSTYQYKGDRTEKALVKYLKTL